MPSPATLLRRFDEEVREFISLCLNVGRLRRRGNTVVFESEGGISVRVPHVRYADLLSAGGRTRIRQCLRYVGRPHAETLLRRTVFGLFKSGHLDERRSIIDIGSWIGDNTVVWAKLLSGGGVVYAIDPSQANLEFGKTVATLSGVGNVEWVQAVCAEQSGLEVSLCGDLEHAQFSDPSASSEHRFVTKTLDDVVPREMHDTIALLHVDVEGFEKKVLLGARGIIASSRPVIIFEQHISKEDPRDVADELRAMGYSLFMLNEVIPGCDLDCRNFVAFPPGKEPPSNACPDHHRGRAQQIWYATLGPELLPAG
jgi:FkbM family methyltransferase